MLMDLERGSNCLSAKMSPSDTDSSVSVSSQRCEASATSEAAPSEVISDNVLQSQSFLDANTVLENQKEFMSVNSDLKVLSVGCSENCVNEDKVASDGNQLENILSVHMSCTSRDCAQVSIVKDELNIENDNTDESDLVFKSNVDSSASFLVSEMCTLEPTEEGAEEKPVSAVNMMKLQAAVQPHTSTAIVTPVANKDLPLSSIEAISSKYIKIAPKLDSSNVGNISILIPNKQRQKINQNSGAKLNNISTLILSNESNVNVKAGPSILHTLLLTNESNNQLIPVDGTKSLTSDQKIQCLKQKNTKRIVKTKPFKKTASKPPGVPGALRIPSTLTIIPQPASGDISARDVSVHNVPVSICDNLPKKQLSEISNSVKDVNVFNRLRKLGTIVEVESKEKSLNNCGNGYVPLPVVNVNKINKSPLKTNKSDIKKQCLKMIESLAEADVILSDLTKKKKKKNLKKGEVLEEQTKSDNIDKIRPSKNSVSSNTINSETKKFHFQLNSSNIMELSEGQKVFACDICSAVYYRSFSLKRHYLKSHINYKHISQRDLHNCRITVRESVPEENKTTEKNLKILLKNEPSRSTVKNTDVKPIDFVDLYQCRTCWVCFCDKSDLKLHLMEHPPVSLINMKNPLKAYKCVNCNVTFYHKRQYNCHKDACNRENPTHLCFYCEDSFPSLMSRRKHQFKVHHPKKKLHQCFLCKMKMFKDVHNLFKHLVTQHTDEYSGCIPCKLRFLNKSELKKHIQVEHNKAKINTEKKRALKISGKANKIKKLYERIHYEKVTGGNNGVLYKCNVCSKMFNLYLNLCRHHHAAHANNMIAKKKEIRPKSNNCETRENEDAAIHDNLQTNTNHHIVSTSPPPDPETLFFSRVSSNIRENLLHHLDGKLDSQEVLEYDLNPNTSTRNKILNFSATFTPEKDSSGEEKQSIHNEKYNHQSAKITPEKFNFPKNYDGRCGLTLYIKDMSHLDISTQLTMRRNLQRLSSLSGEETNKDQVEEDIPSGLSLVNRGGAEFAAMFGEPVLDEGEGKEGLELSGEWIRPRSYICAACGFKSSSMWEVEEHKAALHPNVWCPHIEVVGDSSSSWDWIYCQKVTLQGALNIPCSSYQLSEVSIPKCSKCQKQSVSVPDLHRHLLECGGDTTWMTTMLAVVSPGSRKSKKWRPFGSRRRRQGNRALKRTIPNTPVKHSCGKIRTKPGDTDTIQKMIANLPPKRATRKVIGDENDIKTRSQATINSVPFSVMTYTNRSRPENMNGKSVKLKSNNNQGTSIISKKQKTENSDKLKDDNINKSKKQKKSTVANENTLVTNDFKKELVSEIKQDVKLDSLKVEGESTVQHDDILTSLQVMPVANKVEHDEPEPFDTSKVIAAMRAAMMNSIQQQDKGVKKKDKKKRQETDKKKSVDDTNIDEDLIICNGCGMQFDNASACQRHRKKCVYYKDNKIMNEKKVDQYSDCSSSLSHITASNKYSCNKNDSNDDRKMPQLRREEPVEETHCGDVDDIPVLSPEDVTKDLSDTKTENNMKNNLTVSNDEKTRRLSLLEITINEVASESFDIDEYKSCKALNEAFQDMVIKSEFKHIYSKKNHTKGNEIGSEDTMATQENKEEITKKEVTVKKNLKQLFSKDKEENKSKLQNVMTVKNIKTIKDSPKPKQIKKKKRSTSLALFLKEVEKLEEEGVIVLGKRRRKESSQKHDITMDTQNSKSETTIVDLDKHADKREGSSVSEENSEVNVSNTGQNKNENYVNRDENMKMEYQCSQNEDIKQKKTRGRQKRFAQMEMTTVNVTKSITGVKCENRVDPKLVICKKGYDEAETGSENEQCLLIESKECIAKTKDSSAGSSQNDDKFENHNNVDGGTIVLQIAADTYIDKESNDNECCVKETRINQKSKKINAKSMEHLENDTESVFEVENNTPTYSETSKIKKSQKKSIALNNKQFKTPKNGKLVKQKRSLSTLVDNLVVNNVCKNTNNITISGKPNTSNKSSMNDDLKELQKDVSESSSVFKSKGLKRKLGSLQKINDEQKELQKKVKKNKLCNEVDTKVNVRGKISFEKKRVLTIKEKLGNRYKYKIRKLLKKKDEDLNRSCTKSSVLVGESIESEKTRKKKKIKIGSGIARNKWEVSVISVNDFENKRPSGELEQTDIQIQCEGNGKSELTNFFCSTCDLNFPTAFRLYEHKLSTAHRHKETVAVESGRKTEVNEPLSRTDGNEITVKCCKSLHNVISDLEKRTLTVAKVVNKLKQRDSTDSITEDLRTNGANSVVELPLVDTSVNRVTQPLESNAVDTWTSQALHNQDWNSCQEWLSRSTTPLWDSNQQSWENDAMTTYSVSCTSSLGSILDSVNKILTDPDVTTPPLGLPQYSLTDLQKAMGASDEEMAMLQQLGEGSLQEEYVYDNSKRTPEPVWTEEGPTLMDLDNQEPSTSNSNNQEVTAALEQRKSEPSENEDLRQCRGLMGRPRRLLTDYESREMVCPTCSKHFLGLSALQYHVAWSHCVPVSSSARCGGLKKRALLNGCEEVDRRLVCFVCKEIVSSADLLDAHIQSQHMKKPDVSSTVERSDCAEKLKSKMSSALGGLLDRALNNLLGTKSKGSESIDAQPELNSGALQLLGKLCAVKKRTGNDLKLSGGTLQLLGRLRAVKNKDDAQLKVHNNQSLATELRNILNRGRQYTPVNKAALAASVSSPPSLATEVNPISLLDHLAVCSNDVQQKPYGCPICGIRFSIPSTRNRHIARAHGTYGRKYDEDFSQYNSTETSNSDDFDNDWRDQMSPSADSGHENNVDGENEINPLCSDCGLSFQSIQEVVQHRKEDHPRRFSADSALSDPILKGQVIENCNTSVMKEAQGINSEIEVKKQQPQELVKNGPVKRRGRPARSETVSKSRGRSVKVCDEYDGNPKKKHVNKKSQVEFKYEQQGIEDSEVESARKDIFKNVGDEAFDKLLGKEKSNDVTTKTECEENLGKPKKIDRRKARLTNMGEEAVRVKAEAALRELNLPKKNKTLISSARWGVNALKFTKQPYQNLPSVCTPNVSPSKAKFVSLSEKKWKSVEELETQFVKPETFEHTECMKPDVYDFFDEDAQSDKKMFTQKQELSYNEMECNLSEGIKRKPSTEYDLAHSSNHKNKLRTDSS